MKKCKTCGEPRNHNNALISRCIPCQTEFTNSRKKKVSVKQISKKRQNRIKESGEANMFKEIWEERVHVCEICSHPIPDMITFCFAHRAPKGTYPELRNNKDNISLVCSIKCHGEVDMMYRGIKRQDLIRKLKESSI